MAELCLHSPARLYAVMHQNYVSIGKTSPLPYYIVSDSTDIPPLRKERVCYTYPRDYALMAFYA
jgi:hypothetical protein